MKVREIFDRDGHTEEESKPAEELISIVETWLKNNSFIDLFIEEGIEQIGQTFGRRTVVELNCVTGEIRSSVKEPGTTNFDEPFWITLCSQEHIFLHEESICEGDDMVVTASKEAIESIADWEIEDLKTEKVGKNEYKISWWDNQYEINARDFVEKLMGESYTEWEANYIEWFLGEMECEWEEAIDEFFTEYYRFEFFKRKE